MSVTLTPRIEALIQEKLNSGNYNDASEVVGEALRLLDERDKLSTLRAAIAVGREQANRGETIPWSAGFMDQLIAEADEEDRLGLPIDDDVKP